MINIIRKYGFRVGFHCKEEVLKRALEIAKSKCTNYMSIKKASAT